jgi:hypothetical protein
MTFFVETIDYQRECGSCSECCKGWLTGTIYDYEMSPNYPCHFVDSNKCDGCCTIYEHRPEMCSSYKCTWLTNPIAFPEWLKPEKSKVIVTERFYEDEDSGETFSYWQVKECGQKIDSISLNYLLIMSIKNNINIEYEVAGQFHYHGSDRFLEVFLNRNKDSEGEDKN